MGGNKNIFKTTISGALFCVVNFIILANTSQHSKEGNSSVNLVTNKVDFSDGNQFVVEWKVDQKAGRIEFKLNVAVDERGWVLLGFMPATSKNNYTEKPITIKDSHGDFVLTWLSSASNRKTLDLNTIKTAGVLQIDDNNNYQIIAENSGENSSIQVLQITRKLDTGDPQDVPITDRPMWLFGACNTSAQFVTELAKIRDSINDSLRIEKVIFITKSHDEPDDNTVSWQVIQEKMKKHWIGVVIGMSGLLTMMIVVVIYLCSRTDKIKTKKVKMSVYKEDTDDEARVAFLHSHT